MCCSSVEQGSVDTHIVPSPPLSIYRESMVRLAALGQRPVTDSRTVEWRTVAALLLLSAE